jgi:hypothetical protein
MADQSVVHIGENSPEQVAYRLMETIAWLEGYSIPMSAPVNPSDSTAKYPDRQWLLNTYKECISAVR